MRVLLIDLAQSFGGAEVRVIAQLRGLQGRVEQCKVVCIENSALHQRLVKENLPYVALHSGRGSPMLLQKLRHIIREGHYDVVDAHNVQSILWGITAAFLAGAKGRVATIHSDFGAEYPNLKGRVYEGVLSFTRLFTKQYINVTEVLQDKAKREGFFHKANLIPNAVPVPDDVLLQRKSATEWGFSDNDYVVGILARLKPVKGHTYLLDAFAQLGDIPQAKLLICGEGELGTTLQDQAKRLGIEDRVVFAGFRQDIPHILQSIDCMCLASLSEALPYAILEGASYARPLLVTDVGGLRTLLKHKETAYIVPSQNAQGLADGVRWMVAHPQESEQMALNAYKMVKTQFNLETMIHDILVVYEKALA
jgi:L-malate glycosyltransferase